ncbi:MAG: ADP-L-glycero-D-mannoheptose-6-epimerase, partial [Candidatus Wallbacteria bacterium]|nr:ADP-L-glycero-D-mannoheptose-6-epimerase [Candidatus Wallbacteria bacterium]
GLFNIGTGLPHTWNELVSPIFKALGKPELIDYIDMPNELRDKYQYYTSASVENLRKAGYSEPFTALPDAVHDYVVNYLVRNGRLEPEA